MKTRVSFCVTLLLLTIYSIRLKAQDSKGASEIKIQPGKQTENVLKLESPAKGRPESLAYLAYVPKDYDKKTKLPLLLFLHGLGESGEGDFEKLKIHGPPKLIAKQGRSFPFVVISPQSPHPGRDMKDVIRAWKAEELIQLLDHIEANVAIDSSRVYVTGHSMGGFGAFRLLAKRPDRIAAAVVICGGGDPAWAKQLKSIPIWVFHGGKDPVVPLKSSETMVTAIQRAGGDIKLTVYPEAGHDSWTSTYENPKVYQWMLQQRKQ